VQFVLIIVYWAILILWLLFIARLVLDLIQAFSPRWRPQGVMLIVAETIYTPTDPPLRAMRRLIPPLPVGGMRIDLAFIIITLLLIVALQLVGALIR
jgi:YggT family protein